MLSLADEAAALDAEDLERLADSAYLTGRDDDYLGALERAHRAHLDGKDYARATRCAFWLGLRLMFRGEMGPATGWLARARRLLEREPQECVEHGYLLLPVVEEQMMSSDLAAALQTAARAAELGDRFGDSDLSAVARHLQGHVLLAQGQNRQGLGMLDEAMVAVTAGELSPLVTGLIYCSVIDGCQQVHALGRAREWTEALAKWCEDQPELVAFTGICRAHRAEILQMQGSWQLALEEAQRACDRCLQVRNRQSAAAAFYQVGEVHRMRGDWTAAEDAFRSASQWGWEPQPGLALLRLGQGRKDLAAAAIQRVLDATSSELQRTRLLPAYVEIMLAVGETGKARTACDELDEKARRLDIGPPEIMAAKAAQARGAVELAAGDARAALVRLRSACSTWDSVQAPHLAATVRGLIGLACRSLGDEDSGRMELEAALAEFERLGAKPDASRVSALLQASSPHPGGLSGRELEILRLVATGGTNKAIATKLCLSERTVDRHVSNIFRKLDVETRAAATAYAYEHQLV